MAIHRRRLAATLLACLLPAALPAQDLPLTGHIALTGAPALSNLLAGWTQAFADLYPGVDIALADSGGSSGVEALFNGTADLVLTAQQLDSQQIAHFTARFGYPPQGMAVALDAVLVFVNDANPLAAISLQALDAIFSATHACGEEQALTIWGHLNLSGELAGRKIDAYGPDAGTAAHTNTLFRQIALCGGEFNADFQATANPAVLLSALIFDPTAIAFAGPALPADGMHALAIAINPYVAAVPPTADNIRGGQYPLGSILFIYSNRPRGEPLPAAIQAFAAFVLSQPGQDLAARAGYLPLR